MLFSHYVPTQSSTVYKAMLFIFYFNLTKFDLHSYRNIQSLQNICTISIQLMMLFSFVLYKITLRMSPKITLRALE